MHEITDDIIGILKVATRYSYLKLSGPSEKPRTGFWHRCSKMTSGCCCPPARQIFWHHPTGKKQKSVLFSKVCLELFMPLINCNAAPQLPPWCPTFVGWGQLGCGGDWAGSSGKTGWQRRRRSRRRRLGWGGERTPTGRWSPWWCRPAGRGWETKFIKIYNSYRTQSHKKVNLTRP